MYLWDYYNGFERLVVRYCWLWFGWVGLILKSFGSERSGDGCRVFEFWKWVLWRLYFVVRSEIKMWNVYNFCYIRWCIFGEV